MDALLETSGSVLIAIVFLTVAVGITLVMTAKANRK